jgi:arabinose-5-phosphate isomerase
MLSELLKKGRESLNDFFDQFEIQEMESLINMILENDHGMVFFTGVGKSGLIAKKIAQTMTSTGTKSLYISPLDALHGDIGIVKSQDIFFLLSKSGESDELLNLLPILRSKNVKTIAIVSNVKSRLAKACDIKIHLPCKHELCPFDMAPTISTTIQMIFGDILAIGLMKQRNFSQDQFAENHPAGRIGKRINLKVKDLMVQGASLPLCRAEDKMADVLVELSNKCSGCILVVNDDHHLEGIFTDGDLRRSLQNFGPEVLQKPMHELMTVSPKFIAHDTLALHAMQIMENDQKKAITVLPVLDAKKVIGLIRLHDILQSGI